MTKDALAIKQYMEYVSEKKIALIGTLDIIFVIKDIIIFLHLFLLVGG